LRGGDARWWWWWGRWSRVLRKHFMHLSPWERSCMLTTSPKETKQTSLILKVYCSIWNGKVLLNKED
jgi:hypothetical protein